MLLSTLSGTRSRRGFTLLEVLLASAIGLMLMAVLYVAMEAQLRHAQAGREVIEQSALARALLSRMAGDIQPSLGAQLPASSSGSGGMGGGAGGGGASGSGATGASGAASTTPTTSVASSTTGSINLGVQGSAAVLTLTVSRLPRELMIPPNAQSTSTNLPVVSDQRRITYWLASSGGLARQEVKAVFSPDAMSVVPPDIPDEGNYIIAEDVRSLSFSYWDGTQWLDTWDGTQPGADGTTPMGPPVAIAITATIAPPGSDPNSDQNVKTYRHVVTIPTANGLTTQNGGTSYATPTTGQ